MRKKISYPDYALLRVGDPRNLMVVTGLMTFDTPLDYERLRTTLENSLLRLIRFRQRLAKPKLPFLRAFWEDDPTFRFDSHLIRVQLPFPADQRTLQDLISSLMSKELDYSRPLWEFYLVENYGKGSAIIARVHHSLADGIALVQVLLSLTDSESDPSASGYPQGKDQGLGQARRPVKTENSAVVNSETFSIKQLWNEGKRIVIHPTHALSRSRQIIESARTVGSWVTRWPDPPTIFKGTLGIEKRAAWSEPIELSEVKFIGKEFYSTANDVILTAVAGALGHYIDSRGGATKGLCIRGFIPVNLRPIELDEELGNKFGLALLLLPVGIDDPVERLHSIRYNMGEIKSSSQPITGFGILNFLGAVPARVEEIAVDFIDTKGTVVISNIPGPQTQLYLAGAPINTVMAWVPQFGRIALGVSMISYNGYIRLCLATDKSLVPDPEAILAFFQTEYNEIKSRAQNLQAKRENTLKPMFSALDEALETLDELLAEAKTKNHGEHS